MEQVERMWVEHRSLKLPAASRNHKVAGITLALLESEIATCVYAAIETKGILSYRLQQTLKKHIDLIKQSLPELNGEIKVYLESLLQVALALSTAARPAS